MEGRWRAKIGNKKWEGFWMWPWSKVLVYFLVSVFTFFSIHQVVCLCFCDLSSQSHKIWYDGMLRGWKRSFFGFSFPVSGFGVPFVFYITQLMIHSLPVFITHPTADEHGPPLWWSRLNLQCGGLRMIHLILSYLSFLLLISWFQFWHWPHYYFNTKEFAAYAASKFWGPKLN